MKESKLVSAEVPASLEGTFGEKCWFQLRKYLELHDSSKTSFVYRKVVIERALSEDKFVILPSWLTDFYNVRF